jgi:hypothetical protein
MTGHAKLSPSSAERWMTCPGSVVLSEGMPNKSSAFAEEGTLGHALGEASLLDGVPPQAFIGTDFEYEDHGAAKTATITQEMADHIQVYTDAVQEIAGKLFVEVKVSINDQIYGTADAVVWSPTDACLYIRDLKFGAGVPVECDGNLQLKIYALAALLTMKYPAKTVDVGIVQPRCFHPAGPVRSTQFDVVELLDFHADLMDAAAKVELAKTVKNLAPFTVPSEKGCRWCLAAPKCPALKSKAQTLAKQVFAPGLPYDAAALAETLDFLPILEGWIKNTREFAYGEAEQGHDVPNWKLVEKRATRKWRDEATAAKDTRFLGLEIYDLPSLKSPAAIEKLLPKEQRTLLDELCVKESSGHTLVHESDKRPAIKVDAKSAFANS